MDLSANLRTGTELLLRFVQPLHASMSALSRPAERAGRVGGRVLAPLTGFVSRLRHARMFHPDGIVYGANVTNVGNGELGELGHRLAGPALVRLSSAWWRGTKEWPDVLGLAVRFLRPDADPSEGGDAGDQDLLFATVRFPWTTPVAPLATNVTNFLWNHFHAVSPFDVSGDVRVKFRLRSPHLSNRAGLPRGEHLARAVASGEARYVLEARRLDVPVLKRRWEPVAELALERELDVDQAALHFSPFRDGRGIRPVGFVHHLRRSTYAASQRARDEVAARSPLQPG